MYVLCMYVCTYVCMYVCMHACRNNYKDRKTTLYLPSKSAKVALRERGFAFNMQIPFGCMQIPSALSCPVTLHQIPHI